MTKLNPLTKILFLIWASPSIADNMETIEVYGNFEPAAINQLPSSAWVMDYEQIQSISGSTALDVLAHIPGVTVRNSGSVQEIYLRGAETNFVVLQIDGVQVNNPMDSRGGGFDLASINKTGLIRVEVTKGAQSLSYGSDAIAGVINLITIESGPKSIAVSAGLLHEGKKVLGLRGSSGNWAGSLNAQQSGQQINGDEQSQFDLSLLSHFQPTIDGNTRINLRLSDYSKRALPDQSGGVLYAMEQTKDKKDSRLASASLRHIQSVNHIYRTSIQMEYFRSEDTFTSPGIKSFFNAPPSSSQSEYFYYKTRWLNKLTFDTLNLTLGLDYKSETGETNGLIVMFGQEIATDYRLERENKGGFVDANWSLGKLTIFSGIRFDSTADFNEQTTHKFALDYRFDDNLRLFANWGTAFKLPSIYALSNNLIGNPELKPEEAENFDLAINWNNDSISASFALFHYDYQNLVDFDGESFSLVNRSDIQSQGSELIVGYDISDDLNLSADITYVDIDSGSGELLTGRPKWQGGLAAIYQLSPTIRAHGKLRYVGDTYATSLHTGDFSVHDLQAYDRLDVAIEWQLEENQRLDVHIENVLDRNYEEAVGFRGNEFGVGVQFHWQFRSEK